MLTVNIKYGINNVFFIFFFILKSQTIPEVPPKPGELRTELLGLKERQTDSEKQ